MRNRREQFRNNPGRFRLGEGGADGQVPFAIYDGDVFLGRKNVAKGAIFDVDADLRSLEVSDHVRR